MKRIYLCFLWKRIRWIGAREGNESQLFNPDSGNWIGERSRWEGFFRVNFKAAVIVSGGRTIGSDEWKAVPLSDLHIHAIGQRRKVSNFQFRNFKPSRCDARNSPSFFRIFHRMQILPAVFDLLLLSPSISNTYPIYIYTYEFIFTVLETIKR